MAKLKTLTLDGTVNALRAKGWTVRHYGNPDSNLVYECISPDQSYAIRDEAGLQACLAGTDAYFNSRAF